MFDLESNPLDNPLCNSQPEFEAEIPVEQVTHIGEALKRLVQGAGKDQWNTVFIQPERGRSCNGVVATQVTYPFGFEARLAASDLKSVLTHLKIPTIHPEIDSVLFREAGKKFQLSRLARDAEIPTWDPPSTGHTIQVFGSWMSCLIPILPNQAGNNRFPAIWIGPEGYVGADSSILAWVEAPGTTCAGIVPHQFVERLSSGPLEFGIDPDTNYCWAREGDTVWTGLLLQGNYPPWQSVFFEPDRKIVVQRKDLIEAFRTVTSISRTALLYVNDKTKRFYCTSSESIEVRAKRTKGSMAEASIEVLEQTGDPFQVRIDITKLLGILEKITGAGVSIGTDARMDRILVRTIEMQPMCHILQLGIVGYGTS